MPEYGSAQNQLDKLSLNWQEEMKELYQQIDQLYKKYQADKKVLLTQDMKKKEKAKSSIKKKTLKNYRKRFGQKVICIPNEKS